MDPGDCRLLYWLWVYGSRGEAYNIREAKKSDDSNQERGKLGRHPEGRIADPREHGERHRDGETDKSKQGRPGRNLQGEFGGQNMRCPLQCLKVLSILYSSWTPREVNLWGRVESTLTVVWENRSCPQPQLDYLRIGRDPKRSSNPSTSNSLTYFSR